mgnify:CR=1 FL=1
MASGGGFPYSARRSPWPLGNGLLILSRFPVSHSAYRPYSVKSPGSRDDWIGRGVLAARLLTPWGSVDVYDTHLTHVPSASVVRVAQLLELSQFIKEFSADRPYLLAGERVHLAAEHVDGPVFTEFLGGAAIDLASIKRSLRQVLRVLDFAHSKGVLHGGLTPESILLDGDGILKVRDFGLGIEAAKNAARLNWSSPSDLVAYMAPEVELGPRSRG